MERLLCLLVLLAPGCWGQGVLGVIYGCVSSRLDRHPLAGADILAIRHETGQRFAARTGADGLFSLPDLSPGRYQVSVSAGDQYRGALVKDIEVPVGGFVEQDIRLSLITDLWQRGIARS